MSVIEKMSVMGIRSFGTEDYNKQIIEFFTPLTLILGPNGSGKTTIIECLRYVTTGDTPPNSDRGGSFVHDPKIAQETEVKGQVKIQLTDVMKKKVVASRSLLATQKQKKVQLKTLEGSITRIGTSGEKIHLSSKCAEIDLEMISSLGVSKAILNNVIFCHQEESNWPLNEGKALKQKFDDIFAATRYIKALEEIRKTRVQKMNDINVYKADVAYLKMNRKKAEEISEELEKTEVRFSACQDTVSKIETKLKPVVEELDDISVKMNEIGGLQATLESKKAVSLKLDKNYASLRDSIENIFHGTRENLELERDNFKSSVSQKKKQLEKLKSQCFSKELNYKEILKKKSGHLEELGKLKTENMQHKERVVKRDMILSEKSKLLSLGEITIENGECLRTSQIENILRNWKQQNNMTHQKLADMKEKYECKENEVQSQIDKVRDMKSQLDQKLRSCTDQITKNKSSISNIKEEISFVDGLATKQEELEMDIKETEDEVGLIESSFDVEAIKSKINEWQREKAAMTVEISNLNSEMNKLQNESKTRTEIDLIMKDKGSKQYAIDKMRDMHKETIIHLLGEIPKENVQDAVKSLINTLSHSMQTINKDMDKKKSQFSALQTTKKLQREELKKLQETAAKHRNKIVQACGSQDFDEGLDVLEKTVKELQDEKGALTGSLYIYNKYIEKLGAQHPCCPLCTRNFQRDEEAKSLITDLQRKLQMVPSQLDKKERAIAEHQQRLNCMLQLRPLKETLEMLDAKEIPELKSKIKDASEKIQILTGEISDLEEILDNKDCDLKTASGVLPDLTILDQNLKELERLDRRLSLLKRQLGGDDISRNIKEVSDDLTSLQTKVESIKQHIENNQQHITSHCEQVLMLKGRINDLKAQKLKIASGLQKKNSLKEQMSNLIKENSEVVVITKAAKEELVVLEKQLCDLINKKDHLVKKKEADLDKIRMQINDQEKEIEKINVLSDDINRYIKDGKEKILVDHEDILCNLEAEIHQISDDIATLEGKCNSINKEIINHELKCREYEDNIKLMDFQEEIASLSEESKKLKDKIGGYNIRSIRETRRLLLEEQKLLNKELAETEGRQGELKIQIRKLKDSLKDPMFKDADKKHREKAIQLRTTELVCEDLSKYYVALDRAIMGYHKMKMEEINKIIRDLWMKTYSGNDIDCIEIRSNEDDSEAGLEKAKRTYNYKVVMIKGDTAIDMRGRCSAGQKVLASLIIRLALAETFCLNCGILALDEPTTNLDRDNISSLARGLIEIVQCRSEQKNFQLIIITHDEDFIELLGRSETVDYFYRVSKDNNGLSRLSKCYISEMS